MLLESLKADLLTARKAKDAVAIGLLNPLVSDIVKFGKDAPQRGEAAPREPTDVEAIGKIKNYLENALETLKALLSRQMSADFVLTDAFKDSLVKTEREIAMLHTYLPQQLSETDITGLVEAAIAEKGLARDKSSMGPLMAHLKTTYAGRYDGKIASQVVTRILSA